MTAFRKMHGLGNDFVVFDGRNNGFALDEATARAVADRRTGIGCDQVIHDEDEARWHDEHCCEDMPRGRHCYTDYDPIVGDNDGHECYEDEPEDDYCEGDDDGYDCD